jgi:hypothetical protein
MDGIRDNKPPPARHDSIPAQWVIIAWSSVGRWGPSGGDRASKMPAAGIRNNRTGGEVEVRKPEKY